MNLRPMYLTLAALMLTGSMSLADVGDGFVIVSSNETLEGERVCHEMCANDAQCEALEAGRCVVLNNVGGVCMNLRTDDSPPTDRTLCDADDNPCDAGQLCGQLPGPALVNDFVAHKESRGFDVYLITEDNWGGGNNAIEKTDNLRAWLIANYQSLNLKYVLIIGDPRQDGDVPMRYTKPGMHAEQAWANPMDNVPTDFYFAELTGNWDLDGDGYLAELAPYIANDAQMSGDFGTGGMERDAELAVGRIPYYGVPADVDHILQKTMDFENARIDEIEWRKSALLAAEGANRIFFGEQIRNRILEPNGAESYRVYDAHLCEDFGGAVESCPDIDGTPDALHCSVPNVGVGIESFSPGLVLWLTHGGGQGAAAVMNGPTADALPDDKPFFTFQASCLNSMPSLPSNISYRLLKNGAIATIGATVISHGPGSEVDLRNDAGNAGMAYAYAERLIGEGMAAGDAFNDLRRDIGVRNRWWYWRNYLNFNLWGDPSVGIYSYAEEDDEPQPTTDMGIVDGVDAQVPDDELDMDIADELDAIVANDAAVEVSDAGVEPEMIEPDAQSVLPDGGVSEADMSAGEPMANDAGADSGCHVSKGEGQTPSWAFMCILGGLLVIRQRSVID
jgi:hypothetical protein